MMSEAKFTKGEWCVYIHKGSINGYIDIESSEGELVCSFDFCERAEQRKVADAHLIAAAPEMYELIKMLLKCEHKRGGSLGTDGSFYYKVSEEVFKKADKILAKARGEK